MLALAVISSAAEGEASAASVSSIDESTISSEVDACGKSVRKEHEESCSKKHPTPPAGCTLHPKAVLCILNFICKDCEGSVASETVTFMKKVASGEDNKCDHSAYAHFECPSTILHVLKIIAIAVFLVVPLIVGAVLLVRFMRKKYTEAQQILAKSNTPSSSLHDSKTKRRKKKKKDKSTSKSDKSSDRKKNRT